MSDKDRSPWPDLFAAKFKQNDTFDAKCFYWSGKVYHAFNAELAERYCQHLLDFYKKHNGRCKIYIYAKSLGAIVVECALRRLFLIHPNIEIEIFLRVATPDMRSKLSMPNVKKVFGIYSTTDKLYLLTVIPLSIACMIRLRKSNGSISVSNKKISGVSHSAFNLLESNFLDADNKRQNLFQIYLGILTLDTGE